MKHLFLAFFFFLPPPGAEFNVPRLVRRVRGDAQLQTIKIVTWNIDHGAHLDLVTGELRSSNADLCLLQEVDWNAERSGLKDVAFDLAEKLDMNVAYGTEFEELSQEKKGPAYIGQATLTRLPLGETRVLRFQRQSSFWQPHSWLPSSLPMMQRRIGSRIALVTELQFAGKLLVVYNPHLESRSMGSIQTEQLDELLADLARYPAGTSAVIAGDINSKYFPSVFLRKMEKAGFRSALGKRIERTHAIAMSLDWIFVRGPFTLEGGEVRRATRGSDHYPIEVRMKIEENR